MAISSSCPESLKILTVLINEDVSRHCYHLVNKKSHGVYRAYNVPYVIA